MLVRPFVAAGRQGRYLCASLHLSILAEAASGVIEWQVEQAGGRASVCAIAGVGASISIHVAGNRVVVLCVLLSQ